jgi:hypothetical protein
MGFTWGELKANSAVWMKNPGKGAVGADYSSEFLGGQGQKWVGCEPTSLLWASNLGRQSSVEW